MAVAENLKRQRERRQLTQQQLAVAANLSVITVSRIERGATKPDLSTLEALAGALDTSVPQLLADAGSEDGMAGAAATGDAGAGPDDPAAPAGLPAAAPPSQSDRRAS